MNFLLLSVCTEKLKNTQPELYVYIDELSFLKAVRSTLLYTVKLMSWFAVWLYPLNV